MEKTSTTVCGYKLYLFPFELIEKDEEIILYGFGNVGHQYYWQIQNRKYCKVKYIVDKNSNVDSFCGVDIKKPEYLKAEHNIKVVLGIKKGQSEVIEVLKRYGFKEEEIIRSDEFIIIPVTEESIYVKTQRLNFSLEDYINLYGKNSYEYLKKINDCIHSIEYTGIGKNDPFIRVGNEHDGGYIMLDTFDEYTEKIAYSFGIADDVSWDNDMADRGFEVFMYDHTIDALPIERREFHFYKIGISSDAKDTEKMMTMASLLKENGHENCKEMILKMDVEGAEYGFINNTDMSLLDRFDQIVLELHNLLNTDFSETIINALNKLRKTHDIVHIHANNFGDSLQIDSMVFADCLEITLVNKKRISVLREKIGKNRYLDIDRPCWLEQDEIFMKIC